MLRLFACCLGVLIAAGCAGEPGVLVTVVHVRDADTVEVVTRDGLRIPVRLEGIDAPERGSPTYRDDKAALTALVLGRRVRLVQHADPPLDRWNRPVGRLYLGDLDVQQWLVDHGHAAVSPWP